MRTSTERNGLLAVTHYEQEIASFAKEATGVLSGLNFKKKRVIVIDVIDQVIGTRERLQVSGYMPATLNNYVAFKTIHRHCWLA